MVDILAGSRTFDEFLKEMLKNPKYKKAYDDLDLEFQIIDLQIRRRIKGKISQASLSGKLGSNSQFMSQFENGKFNPSLNYLKKLAKDLDAKLVVKIE